MFVESVQRKTLKRLILLINYLTVIYVPLGDVQIRIVHNQRAFNDCRKAMLVFVNLTRIMFDFFDTPSDDFPKLFLTFYLMIVRNIKMLKKVKSGIICKCTVIGSPHKFISRRFWSFRAMFIRLIDVVFKRKIDLMPWHLYDLVFRRYPEENS